jgi:hypothetical protein
MSDAPITCPLEADVVEAVLSGAWPTAVEPELRVHASECPICAEVADVAGAVCDDRDALSAHANVPSPSQVWWQAAMQARVDAQRAAARPIIILQRIAAACTAGAIAAIFTWIAARTPWSAVAALLPTLTERSADLAQTSAFARESTISIVLAFAACALFAPVVLYLLLSDD